MRTQNHDYYVDRHLCFTIRNFCIGMFFGLSLMACSTPAQQSFQRSQTIEQSDLIQYYLRTCPNGVNYYNRSAPSGYFGRGYVSDVSISCK